MLSRGHTFTRTHSLTLHLPEPALGSMDTTDTLSLSSTNSPTNHSLSLGSNDSLIDIYSMWKSRVPSPLGTHESSYSAQTSPLSPTLHSFSPPLSPSPTLTEQLLDDALHWQSTPLFSDGSSSSTLSQSMSPVLFDSEPLNLYL